MRFIHFTIQTSKSEEEIAFYQKWTELFIIRKFGSITFLGNGDPKDTLIEIIASTKDVQATNISIGFEARDINKLRDQMIEEGLNPTSIISPNPVTSFFFVKDPAGIDVQFVQA